MNYLKAPQNGKLLREIAADFGISTTHVHRLVGGGKGGTT